jgi:hypothetical protein
MNPNQTLFQLMLRAQIVARQDGRAEKGSSLLMVTIGSIMTFSLLGAFFTMSNLSKSSTNAYIDGNNTFYAAESGLNKRAEQIRQKFIGYSTPAGLSPGQATAASVVSSANISNCFPLTTTPVTTNDFECRNYPFKYNNNAAEIKSSDGKSIIISDKDNNRNTVNYTAYTFVADKTNYSPTLIPPAPVPQAVPAGEIYAGLNAQEYRYTVYATAAKPSTNTQQSDANTVLQMEFKSRVIPLFQFAAFYDGDLEMNSSSNMTISGWVHTNSNLYVQPNTTNTGISTTFLARVTSAGSIYNRVDAFPTSAGGITQVLKTGTSCTPTSNCEPFPTYLATNESPLTSGEINAFVGRVRDGAAGSAVLTAPEPGFLRKRNYSNNNIGEYFAKADLRLEMVPDRDVTSTGVTPWTRNTAIIPFNFTAIRTGGTGACTTTAPIGTDPAANYIAPERMNASTLTCNVFTKGQLQSLRQPVLVWTHLNQAAPLRPTEDLTLGKPVLPATLPALSAGANNDNTRNQILRALQVALASTPSPVELDRLNTAFSNAVYNAGSLNSFKAEFSRLINTITTLTSTDRTNLLAATPNEIAALQSAWFLPAPIQRVATNNNPDNAVNVRSSGFYDGRERRWITMLQTNIASLSVWNRDGLYVEATDNTLTTPYSTNVALQNTAFNSGNGANFTNSFAFTRSAADTTKPVGTLQYLGLGSLDSTEGGLVFHATVNDDLNGNGTFAAADDVTTDIANPILKRNPDGTNFRNSSGQTVTIDLPRRYRNGNTYQSPFGFAFNGGNYLPAPLTLVTDQAIYVQGDFNNNGAIQPAAGANIPSPNRLPGAIIGDTITVLSNQCLSASSIQSTTNHLGVPAGQIQCGLPRTATGSVNVTVGTNTATYYTAANPTAVNAAFLSYTDRSIGNLGAGRGYTSNSANDKYSGGLNNYMRMLEDWGASRNFNYSGSFVSLGTPLEYNGTYIGGGTYYNIPVRNFNYDTNFNTFSTLPPLTPRAIYLQQNVFQRSNR